METNSSSTVSTATSEASFFHGIRELLESFALALVLVFTLKTFLIELFIIPTGSMAPTLRGFHKDVTCRFCGAPFLISASEEFPEASGDGSGGQRCVVGGSCSQCRFPMYVGNDNVLGGRYPSFKGDRILVCKYHAGWREPDRWDVTVFRYPGKAQTNYIKRLVGLPNETVRIQHGDIFVRHVDEASFRIQTKPLPSLQAMLQTVYDNDAATPPAGTPPRWLVDSVPADSKRFELDSTASERDVHLSYQHSIPTSEESHALIRGERPTQLAPGASISPQLICDFNAYNTGVSSSTYRRGDGTMVTSPSEWVTPATWEANGMQHRDFFCTADPSTLGLNWVGDLALACRVSVKSDSGTMAFSLVKGGTPFIATIDVATGETALSIAGVPEFVPVTAITPIRGRGDYDVLFANVDEEMRLVINGREVDFGGGGSYEPLCVDTLDGGEKGAATLARDRSPTRADLSPVTLTASNGLTVEVAHLQVKRDIYYIAANSRSDGFERICDLVSAPFRRAFARAQRDGGGPEARFVETLTTPEWWSRLGKTRQVEVTLRDDEFFMCGDNSARSKDGRLWTEDGIPPVVPRELLVGEAVLVYWPHGKIIPWTSFALVPNLPLMRLIH